MTEESNVSDLRSADRYILHSPMEGSFGAAGIRIINFSATGFQAGHDEPLKLGAEARLAFTIPGGPDRIVLRARVVWSHLAQNVATEHYRYLSGIRAEENDELSNVMHHLIDTNVARPDDASIERKKKALTEKARERAARSAVKPIVMTQPGGMSTDEVLMIQHARERLQSHPDEAVKWYARAKYATNEDHTKVGGALHHYKEEVLAIWEYLEHTIPLEKIVKVFEDARK